MANYFKEKNFDKSLGNFLNDSVITAIKADDLKIIVRI